MQTEGEPDIEIYDDNKRKRSSLACVRCRKRHVKCPGGNPCKKCIVAKVACEYLEPNKKLIVSMKYLQKLQDDISALKRENATLRNQGKDESGVPLERAKSDEEIVFQENTMPFHPQESEVVPTFADRPGHLVESRTGQKYYVGSSSMTLFGLEIQNMISSTSGAEPVTETEQLTETVLQEEGNAYKMVLAKNDGNDISVNFTLPSYSYAMLLVDTFITFNDGCFYFFNEGLVKENLRKTYEGLGTDLSTIQTIWFCKVLLIFAIGEMYLGTANHANGNKLDKSMLPGSSFFNEASQIFSALFSSGRIENCTKEGGIEVMLLYAFYLQVADCTIASYFYFGQALRSCMILGWHVDAERETITRFELEHRRRLWWTVYMFERMLSSKAGLPLSFTDNAVTTELPDDFDMSLPPPGCEHYIFPEAQYITSCVKITQINAKILSKLYSKQPDSNILPVLTELVPQLLAWMDELPDFLQVDFAQEPLKISRLCTNMYTEYYQGINLAVRPLLFHFAMKQLNKNRKSNTYIHLQDYPQTISSLLNSSLQASINTIRSFWALMPENMVALFGYMDREYLFTSAATLILFNAAFGIHNQTYQHLDHALTMFTKMRNLGNNPAELRRSQLLKLMSTLDFNHIMKELIAKHTDELKPNNIYDHGPDVDIVALRGQTSSAAPSEASDSKRIAADNYDSLAYDGDLLKSLEQMDSQIWKEISDQAMWLTNDKDFINF